MKILSEARLGLTEFVRDLQGRAYRVRKENLFTDLSGTILEIGPGTGVNFRYYPKGIRWIGIEPYLPVHPYLEKAAKKAGVKAKIKAGTAEKIGLPSASIDIVVGTLVLCSVENPSLVLREIKRVLKPGGKFLFLEHTATPEGTRLHWLQNAVASPWRRFFRGCNPNLETWKIIKAACFSEVVCERYRQKWVIPIVSPHIIGWARK